LVEAVSGRGIKDRFYCIIFDYFQTLDQISDLAWKLSLENDVVITQVLASKEQYTQNDSPFMMTVHREAIPV